MKILHDLLIINVEKGDTSSIAAKIHNMERQMLEGKLVLVGDDVLPLNAKHSSEVSSKTVWVMFHDVPIIAFMEDGLSAIATKLCTLFMLDSYMLVMCTESWRRSSYARAMIELRADAELKDILFVVVPKIESVGYTLSTIHIEY
ncbi:hypothetical protein Tco_0807096 [Tanacetum coccineum]